MSIPSAYITVVLIWATTPLAIKWSSAGLGYSGAAFGRMAIGASIAVLLVLLLRIPFPWHARAQRGYALASLGVFGAMSLVYWSSQFVPSGLISVLFGVSPILSGVMAYWLLDERALSPIRVIALLCAVGGLSMVFGGEAFAFGEINVAAVKGLMGLSGATILFSLSAVLVKRYDMGIDPLAHTAGTLLYALPGYALLWYFLDGQLPEVLESRAIMATLYLGVFGSVVGFVAYYYVLQRLTAATVALIPLLTPVLALMLGSALEGEVLSDMALKGAGLILTSLAVYQIEGMLRPALR